MMGHVVTRSRRVSLAIREPHHPQTVPAKEAMNVHLQNPLTENRHLLGEWVDWLKRNRYAPTTIYGYMRIVQKLIDARPEFPVEKLTAEDLERYFEGRGLSNATYKTQMETLRAWFGWLMRHRRLIRTNPCEAVDMPPVRRRLRHILTPDEFRRLCRTTHHLRELAALHLMFYSGLRINELAHLKVGDLDFERRLVRIRFGKGSQRSGPRERWSVLHRDTIRVLKLYLWQAVKLHPDLWLLGRRSGRPPATASLRWWFAQRRVEAGLPEDVTPHALRSGFCHNLKTHGVSIEVAANLMGHEDMEVTRRIYGRLSLEDMVGIYERAMLPQATERG